MGRAGSRRRPSCWRSVGWGARLHPAFERLDEAADELLRRERHHALPLRTLAAVVFVAEGDAGLVVGDQTLIGDGDPVGVAREIGEHGLGAGERRLGVDHPSIFFLTGAR